MASTGLEELDRLLGDGYPDRSVVLVVRPAGIGKEALGYWFVRSGLIQGDYCLYATRRPVSDVLRDHHHFRPESFQQSWVHHQQGNDRQYWDAEHVLRWEAVRQPRDNHDLRVGEAPELRVRYEQGYDNQPGKLH